MTDDALAIRAGLCVHRATLEDAIAALLATFTTETGLVVRKIWVDDTGAVACRVELGRGDGTEATEKPCCAHEPARHAKDGCWGSAVTAGGAFERCECRASPATAADT